MSKKGQMGVIGIVIGLVFLVIGIVIVTSVVAVANLTGLTATILSYLGVFMALGGLVLAGAIAYKAFK